MTRVYHTAPPKRRAQEALGWVSEGERANTQVGKAGRAPSENRNLSLSWARIEIRGANEVGGRFKQNMAMSAKFKNQ